MRTAAERRSWRASTRSRPERSQRSSRQTVHAPDAITLAKTPEASLERVHEFATRGLPVVSSMRRGMRCAIVHASWRCADLGWFYCRTRRHRIRQPREPADPFPKEDGGGPCRHVKSVGCTSCYARQLPSKGPPGAVTPWRAISRRIVSSVATLIATCRLRSFATELTFSAPERGVAIEFVLNAVHRFD